MTLIVSANLYSAPGDIVEVSAPVLSGSSPEANDIKDGDSNVATQTGAFNYLIPISVPPGRGDATPSLSLNYSSQSGTYGTIAAGWSLTIPSIDFDTDYPENKVKEGELRRYVSGLSGGQRLEVVVEPDLLPDVEKAYRAVRDPNIRYERLKPGSEAVWRARQVDGSVWLFGQAERFEGIFHSGTPKGFFEILGSAPLSTYRDVHGNEVHYYYEMVESGRKIRDFHIVRIEYSHHDSIAGHFAQVEFSGRILTCRGKKIGVGAQLLAKGLTHVRFKGQRTLDAIVTRVRNSAGAGWRPVRKIALAYDRDALGCGGSAAPHRLLASVTETAFAPDVTATPTTLPPLTFNYNDSPSGDYIEDSSFDLTPLNDVEKTYGIAGGQRHRGFWTTEHTMLLDYDGDGLQDRLVLESTDLVFEDGKGKCAFKVQRNTGTGFASSGPQQTLPVPPAWVDAAKEPGSNVSIECSLTGVLARNLRNKERRQCGNTGTRLTYHFIDVNGNGVSELLTSIVYDNNAYDPNTLVPAADNSGEVPADLGFARPPCPGEDPPLCRTGPQPCTNEECGAGSCRILKQSRAGKEESGQCQQFESRQKDGEIKDDSGKTIPLCDPCIDPTSPVPCSNDCNMPGFCAPYPPHDLDTGNLNPEPKEKFCLGRATSHWLCGRYVWLVYERSAGGWGNDSPIVLLAPFTMDSDIKSSSMGAGSWSGENFTIRDINGDGDVDVMISNTTSEVRTGRVNWDVFFGNWDQVNKSFELEASKTACAASYNPGLELGFGWEAPKVAEGITISSSMMMPPKPQENPNVRPFRWARTSTTLTDVNGDGLPDLLVKFRDPHDDNRPNLQVYYNHGDRFGEEPFLLYSRASPSIFSSETIIAAADGATEIDWNEHNVIIKAKKLSTLQARDVDQDGLVDWINLGRTLFPDITLHKHLLRNPGIYFNLGGAGTLPPSDGIPAFADKLSDEIRVFGAKPPSRQHKWATRRTAVDLDGDGYPEILQFFQPFPGHDTAGFWQALRRFPKGSQPLRRLREIDNGRGMRMRVTYAPITDGEVVRKDVLSSHTFNPKNLESVPTKQWVVSNVEVNKGQGADPSIKTTYTYMSPQYRRVLNVTRFRGFSEASIVSPTNRKTIRRYGYRVDPTGRLTAEFVHPDDASGNVHRIIRTKWGELDIEKLTNYVFPVETRTYTCRDDQTIAVCEATEIPRLEIQTVEKLQPDGFEIAVVRETHSAQGEGGPHAGDRRMRRDFLYLADANTFVLRTGDEQTFERIGEKDVLIARTRSEYDPAGLHLIRTHTHIDDTKVATTKFEGHDPAGNPHRIIKPNKNGGTEIEYDSFLRFPVRTKQQADGQPELVTEIDTDNGTGAVLETRGPNKKDGVLFTTRSDIDGFGRSLAEWVSVNQINGYQLEKVSATAYDDANGVVTAKQRIEFDEDRWTGKVSAYDGAGRLLKMVTEAGNEDAIENFTYDDAGRLEAYTGPDPSSPGNAVITYRYSYDSLDRIRFIARPATTDHAVTTFETRYNGRETQTLEREGHPGALGAMHAHKTTRTDIFDRLIEVIEATGQGNALTRYVYEGNQKLIIDPELQETLLVHDFLLRRTRIERAGKIYEYEYDLNGNLTEAISPHPGNDPAPFKVVSVYDGYDRITFRTVRERKMSDTEIAAYGIGTITYTYDQGVNGLGRLTRVEFPNQDWINYAYDARGNVISEQRRAPDTSVAQPGREIATTYNALGQVRSAWYADGLSPQLPTQVRYHYDIRGLLERVELGGAAVIIPLARNQRNLAGMVTDRFSANGTQHTRWGYDAMGRIAEMRVKGAGGAEVTVHSLDYYPFGDVKNLTQSLGATTRTLHYEYDIRHQLRSATETSLGAFSSEYHYNRAGRLERARLEPGATAPAALQVRARDVSYRYDGMTGAPGAAVDPQAVDELRDTTGGTLRARFIYDESGNITRREELTGPGEAVVDVWDFVYDGDDLQRKVTQAGRSETYFYDHTGQRYLAIEKDGAGNPVRTRFFFGPTEIWYGADGAMEKTRTTIGLGQSVARIERVGDDQTIEYLYHSTLQNLIVALDDQGNTNAGFFYGPFGEIIEEVGAGSDFDRRFNDKHFDEVSALSYYGFRYYDTLSLAWTQADPLYRFAPDLDNLNPRAANLYVFALQNPMRYVDPDGLATGTLGGDAGALAKMAKEAEKKWIRDNCTHAAVQNSSCPNLNPKYKLKGPFGRDADPDVFEDELDEEFDELADAVGRSIDYASMAGGGGGLIKGGIKVVHKGGAWVLKKVFKKSAKRAATKSGTTTVGRWMSKAEHKAMIKSKKVQESYSGTTHVADPADASAFLKQAAPGSRYVEFDVPTSALKSTNQGWSKVIGPNSLEGRLATKKGLPVPQMPNATNIIHRADKLR
ncbi:MAG: RHS repeat-associated core domain-containing protein [Pseudomonadota bacterium]